jgi:hypothetical protein
MARSTKTEAQIWDALQVVGTALDILRRDRCITKATYDRRSFAVKRAVGALQSGDLATAERLTRKVMTTTVKDTNKCRRRKNRR